MHARWSCILCEKGTRCNSKYSERSRDVMSIFGDLFRLQSYIEISIHKIKESSRNRENHNIPNMRPLTWNICNVTCNIIPVYSHDYTIPLTLTTSNIHFLWRIASVGSTDHAWCWLARYTHLLAHRNKTYSTH